jgi:hypothetical protein
MTTGVGTCGKLEFSDKIQYIELRFGTSVVSADISELKDGNGASLGANNQAVVTALGAIVSTGSSTNTNASLPPNASTEQTLATLTKPSDLQKIDSTTQRNQTYAIQRGLWQVSVSNPITGFLTEITGNTLFKSGQNIGNTAFIANAGTNLNTSALALETGGNLATIADRNTATSFNSQRLTDGTNFYDARQTRVLTATDVVSVSGANFDGSGNLKVANTSANGVGTQANGSITTGGTAQTALPINTNRVGFEIINTSSTTLYINISGTATINSLAIPPGQSYSRWVGKLFTNEISIFGATTGQTFTTLEI